MDSANKKKLELLNEQTEGDYQAFLYDCDGTLADNMEQHKEAYTRVANDGGVEIDPGMIDELAGQPTGDIVVEMNKRYKSDLDPKEFDRKKSDLFYNEYLDTTKPINFVIEHLKAHSGKIKIAVVSGSELKTVKKTLQVLGIEEYVDTMVCAGDTENGKPSPDPFLLAAKNLGVDPKRCIVFEDGDAGVKAAEAGGMKWIRVDKIEA